jgi:hypothetical protein
VSHGEKTYEVNKNKKIKGRERKIKKTEISKEIVKEKTAQKKAHVGALFFHFFSFRRRGIITCSPPPYSCVLSASFAL